jgi:hypothetical protein
MDQTTRNSLQRATQDARRLLEAEFVAQLEGTYDILPDGRILPEPGAHLDDRQRFARRKIVDAIEHIRAKESGKTQGQAVDDYTREAAFTALNRFVALKMLEARGLVQQCVTKGDLSSGFKEFSGLAPGLADLPDKGYQLYLECLFDELGTEIKVLFDRREPASLLWPRRQTMLELIEILSRSELEGVWDQDETVGWVYQYFNSQEERRAMREASAAPRNSRELAVRNQFFTPRYVVEFLTDNTLGRIWYEMRQGVTALKEQCNYLVRRPTEIFLQQGGSAPEAPESQEGVSQEELLNRPIHVPFRPKKDPRDLKILDPACGSGHFLLYCFELLITIYLEAWNDPTSPASGITGRKLADEYPSLESLKPAIPALILKHNLHGVDIDPRCAQIAALALWMRAQRAFNDFDIARQDRVAVERTSIVVAEPMPGEKSLLDAFVASELSGSPEDRLVGQLVRHVFDAMKLAGETGSLLKIDEEVSAVVTESKKQWKSPPKYVQSSLFEDVPRPAQQEDFRFEVRGISDADFWNELESRIYIALARYAERAESGGYQRRLFAEDAARGFAFIDICRNRYDVVLMNPPFGEPSTATLGYLRQHFSIAADNLLVAFIVKAHYTLTSSGKIGAITDRSFINKRFYEEFRLNFVIANRTLEHWVDLGWNVLDANVEVAAHIHSAANSSTIFTSVQSEEPDLKATVLRERSTSLRGLFLCRLGDFVHYPGYAFVYDLPTPLAHTFANGVTLGDTEFTSFGGLKAGESESVFRVVWEIPVDTIARGDWVFFQNGSPYSPYYYGCYYLVRSDGKTWKQVLANASSRITNVDRYFRPGLYYGKRTDWMYAYKGRAGQVPSMEGHLIEAIDPSRIWFDLLIANSLPYQVFANTLCGQHKYAGYINPIRLEVHKFPDWSSRVAKVTADIEVLDQGSEVSTLFVAPHSLNPVDLTRPTLAAALSAAVSWRERVVVAANTLRNEYNRQLEEELSWKHSGPRAPSEVDYVKLLFESSDSQRFECMCVVSYLVGVAFGRWNVQVATGEKVIEVSSDPFASYPICPPGVLQGEQGLPITKAAVKRLQLDGAWNYLIDIPWDGILVDDPGHPLDIEACVQQVLRAIWKVRWEAIEREACEILGEGSLRDYFRKSAGYFGDHLKRYSKSRRQAPIYWPLSTASGSYTIWLYYHRFKRDTLSLALEDYAKPRLRHEQTKLDRIRGDAGPNPTRGQREEIEAQDAFVNDLSTFVEELARVAPLWNPNLNDGVIINYGPLWRLIGHTPWRNNVKDCFDALVAGEHDWAHLAMHLWPERVVPKCKDDASLAIAHGLDDVFWQEADRGRLVKKSRPEGGWQPVIDQLVAQRTSLAVKSALDSLLNAPALGGTGLRSRAGRTTLAPRRSRTSQAETTEPTRSSGRSLDLESIETVKQALEAFPNGASKAEVLDATGLTDGRWNTLINTFIEHGVVVRTGERRGTRYQLTGGETRPTPSSFKQQATEGLD